LKAGGNPTKQLYNRQLITACGNSHVQKSGRVDIHGVLDISTVVREGRFHGQLIRGYHA
jgi:hypothetical protein